MGFWTSPTGQEVTGNQKDSFLPSFGIIPDGTTALAVIKSCEVIEKAANDYREADKFIEVIYKISSADFKGREVAQKIRVFQGKPESIYRNLNMLKLLMTLCNYKPAHNNEPTNQDLASLCNKTLGIKISEWSMPRKISESPMPRRDKGIMEGNNVSEVHAPSGFECQIGVKAEVTHNNKGVDSAFSRNSGAAQNDLDEDMPF